MSFIKRIENTQNLLLVEKIDFLVVDDPVSLLYLTGLNLSNAKLIIGQNNTRLFVDGRYIEIAKKKSPCTVLLLEDDLISDFFLVHAFEGVVKVAFDSMTSSYNMFQKLKSFLEKLQRQANKEIIFEIVPFYNPLKNIRVIKTQDEISYLRKAANITWRGFEHICSILKEGVTEKTLALEFEIFCRKNGADKLAFDPIICFGENSAMPHHESGETRLKISEIVLIDVGVTINDYHSDMTRVVFFGEPNPLLENFYSIVKKAHHKALGLCKPGVHIAELDKAARDLIEKEGYGKYFVHSLGHGIGLQTHEFPRIKYDGEDKDVPLRPGMVFTIEPGIYKPGLGGVRYEDTILITKDGYENFYSSE